MSPQARYDSGTSCRGAGNASHVNQMQRVLVRKQLTDRWHGTRRGECRRNRCRDQEACLICVHKGERAAQFKGSSCGVALLAKLCRLKPAKQSSDETRARIQYGMDVFSHASVMVLHGMKNRTFFQRRAMHLQRRVFGACFHRASMRDAYHM